MKRVLLALTILAACGPVDVATVSIGLGPVPDNVRTLSVFVVDRERALVVASATVSAPTPQTTFQLGVPAETPLTFRAIGRTDRPGPPLVGGVMPAYAAVADRTIPLGSRVVEVELLARPAGVLTFRPARSDVDEFVLVFREQGTSAAPIRVPFDGKLPVEVSTVLPIGRYRATASEPGGDALRVIEGEGLFVAREQESVANLTITSPRDPERPVRLSVELVPSVGVCVECGQVYTSTGGPTTFDLRIEALDESSASVDVQDVTLMASIESSATVPGDTPPPLVVDLPATFGGFEVAGTARLRVDVSATWDDDEFASGDIYLNAAPARRPTRGVDALVLELGDDDAVASGTTIRVLLVDDQGLLAERPRGQLDFATSDPFVFFSEGQAFELEPGGLGVVSRGVARPSGPRNVPVQIVATLTSSVVPGTWTSTLALPVLTLSASEE